MTTPVVALIADPELLSGIPEAWRRTHADRTAAVDFRVPADASHAALVSAAADAQVVLGCRTPVDAALFNALPRLRLLQQCSAGYDNVDLAAARDHGVTVARVEGSGVTAVAEHTLLCILALARSLCAANATTHAGEWIWGSLYNRIWELRGQTIGLVGFGAIGREVGRLATAFGMDVLYTRRGPAPEPDVGYPARRVDLSTLLATARVVSLHCALTDSTRHLIDADALRSMRPDAVLVNTARGDVVVEAHLARSVTEGWIAGAAVDTFGSHSDHIAADSPLIGIDRVLLTPHSAACTTENLDYTFHHAGLDNLAAWLDGRPLRGVVIPGTAREGEG